MFEEIYPFILTSAAHNAYICYNSQGYLFHRKDFKKTLGKYVVLKTVHLKNMLYNIFIFYFSGFKCLCECMFVRCSLHTKVKFRKASLTYEREVAGTLGNRCLCVIGEAITLTTLG